MTFHLFVLIFIFLYLLQSHLPFAVVGSREEVQLNGEKYRARQYPWGTVLVENETHCDFVKLREMLLRTNMQVKKKRLKYLLKFLLTPVCLPVFDPGPHTIGVGLCTQETLTKLPRSTRKLYVIAGQLSLNNPPSFLFPSTLKDL